MTTTTQERESDRLRSELEQTAQRIGQSENEKRTAIHDAEAFKQASAALEAALVERERLTLLLHEAEKQEREADRQAMQGELAAALDDFERGKQKLTELASSFGDALAAAWRANSALVHAVRELDERRNWARAVAGQLEQELSVDGRDLDSLARALVMVALHDHAQDAVELRGWTTVAKSKDDLAYQLGLVLHQQRYLGAREAYPLEQQIRDMLAGSYNGKLAELEAAKAAHANELVERREAAAQRAFEKGRPCREEDYLPASSDEAAGEQPEEPQQAAQV
jgi:hypothetical protein